MKNSKREEVIFHSATKLFNIVIDIETYPEYIPWCTKMVINQRNKNEIFADMYVKYKFILVQKFGSHVKFDKNNLMITTSYIEGPLKNLTTKWHFQEINKKKSKIIFDVNFEFKHYLHQKIAETFYPLIENKMIYSFKKRADDILD
ncbi:type II toxin-antitoxin system RatA family toxin [Pelagibacterales bacterium SAG-MED31]|nr:type II toxin-antitoxin system RatA family toxin [Pelagibacterales bacterium SAG-MED31]